MSTNDISIKEPQFKSICFQVYPDSGNIMDTLSKCNQIGLSGWCSPLHTPDKGKPHYHLEFIIFNSKSHGFSKSKWQTYIEYAGAANNYYERCFPHNYAAYLVHDRNPEKQQFSDYEIVQFENNISITDNINNVIQIGLCPDYKEYIKIEDNPYMTSNSKQSEQLPDVMRFVRDNMFISYAALTDWVMDNKTEWLMCVLNNSRPITAYMRSIEYAKRQE